MVSRMDSICERYAAGCTKTRTKILQPENSENGKNAPGLGRKRRNRVRFGCWRGWQRLGTDKTRCEKPKFEPKRTPFPCTTCKKKPGRNTVFPPGLWQGQKDLNPRHAVLEWMWKQTTGSGVRPVSPGSCRKSQNGRCWFGAVRKNEWIERASAICHRMIASICDLYYNITKQDRLAYVERNSCELLLRILRALPMFQRME